MTAKTNAERWEEYKVKYPYWAECGVQVKPQSMDTKIYGEHASVVLVRGVRTWGFLTEEYRTRFLIDMRRWGARKI